MSKYLGNLWQKACDKPGDGEDSDNAAHIMYSSG